MFGTALPNTVTIVAYAEFANDIEIDRNRNIVYDMNTIEISEYLNRDLICSKFFYGVYSANKIHKLRSLPVLIFCNTDTSNRPEEHWIVL